VVGVGGRGEDITRQKKFIGAVWMRMIEMLLNVVVGVFQVVESDFVFILLAVA